MLHTNNPIIKHKAGLLNLAESLQNVSKACKIMGVSRDTFYRYQELVETDGLEGLINRERRVPNLKNRVDEGTEQARHWPRHRLPGARPAPHQQRIAQAWHLCFRQWCALDLAQAQA